MLPALSRHQDRPCASAVQFETTRPEINDGEPDLESTLGAIEKCKSADEVFALLNGFLSGIRKTSTWAHPSLGPTPVQSAAHIAIWLGNLKAVTSKGDQIAPEAGEILAKLYAVMQQRPGSSKISRKATSETDLMAPLITKRARGIT